MKKKFKYVKRNFAALKNIWCINKLYVILSFVWTVVFIPIQVFEVYSRKLITDGLINGESFVRLLTIILLLGGAKIVRNSISDYYENTYKLIKKEEIEQTLKIQFLNKISTLDIECFDDTYFFDRYVKALSEADSRYFTVLDNLCSFVNSLISIIAFASIIISLDSILLLFSILPVLVSLISSNKKNRLQYDFFQETVPFGRKVSYIRRIFYLNNYAKEIKIHQSSRFFLRKLKNYYSEYTIALKKFGRDGLKINLIKNLLLTVIPVLMQIYLLGKTVLGYLSVGSFAALESTTWTVSDNLKSVFQIMPKLRENSWYLRNIDDILNYEPKIKNKTDAIALNKNLQHEIEVKNLSFTYPNNTERTLHDISMKIHPGEKIAIVGYNGAGKSTFIKLLMRLYDTHDDAITIDGISIKDYNLESLRDNIGVAFQDFQYYAYSFAENILFQEKEELEKAQIRDLETATKYSGLYDKIHTYDKGLFTNLTKEFDNEGAVLSGGEIQKLALARAFAKNCSVLILDEPTSAMDPIAENELYQNMLRIAENKTLIFISHKLSSAKLADTIYLFENGTVTEHGSHAQLMELNGNYAKMFRTQSKYYRE